MDNRPSVAQLMPVYKFRVLIIYTEDYLKLAAHF